MARLDRVTSTYMMALSDGPVEPGHDVNGKSQRLSALVLYVPLTALTRGMINALALDQMQPHAVLINCSRGPVIDFAALHDALKSGRIAGAGLDVFPSEPPSPSEPVLSLDNVMLTSHHAGSSRETRVKQTRNAFDNVLRVARGEGPLWVVPELRNLPPRT
jgi:D-3-phosphoglycerate dehydrogenase